MLHVARGGDSLCWQSQLGMGSPGDVIDANYTQIEITKSAGDLDPIEEVKS